MKRPSTRIANLDEMARSGMYMSDLGLYGSSQEMVLSGIQSLPQLEYARDQVGIAVFFFYLLIYRLFLGGEGEARVSWWVFHVNAVQLRRELLLRKEGLDKKVNYESQQRLAVEHSSYQSSD